MSRARDLADGTFDTLKVFDSALTDSLSLSVNTSSSYAGTVTQDDTGLTFNNNTAVRGYTFKNNTSNTIISLDSDGLKFNGDTAAANALDDFETGSWSPSVSNGSFQNVLDAHYIKIGNQVTVWLYAQSISDITTASNFEISNLPFTSSTDVDSVTGTVMLRYLNRSSSEQTNLISYMAQNGTTLRIYAVINNANYAVVRNSDFSNGNIGLRITLTYIAA